MFTGLVAMQGRVVELKPEDKGCRLTIAASLIDNTIELGESIAVNGVCLTVVEFGNEQASFQLAPETLKRSNLGSLAAGSNVNLERALRLGDRLGGHWVQGHVDGVAKLLERKLDGEWVVFHFSLPATLKHYLVSKGSITINGVSLTVVAVTDTTFSVALIPLTLSVTNLGALREGDKVNLEVDILAKYIERMMSVRNAT